MSQGPRYANEPQSIQLDPETQEYFAELNKEKFDFFEELMKVAGVTPELFGSASALVQPKDNPWLKRGPGPNPDDMKKY